MPHVQMSASDGIRVRNCRVLLKTKTSLRSSYVAFSNAISILSLGVTMPSEFDQENEVKFAGVGDSALQ